MSDKVNTVKIGNNGADYAKVADRLLKFRTDFPHSKIETLSRENEDGTTTFKAWIWREKSDYIDVLKSTQNAEVARSSADADGEAKGKVGVKDKDYEKLQSISVGRALAMVGYAASGEIASFEEMEEFNEYRAKQKADAISEAIQTFSKAKNLEELKKAFIASNMMQEPAVVAAKDARKGELTERSKDVEA
jgi:hypothetical protein